MSGILPFDETPESSVLPRDTYKVAVADIEDGFSSGGNRMLTIYFEVTEPVQYAGLKVKNWYVIGSPSDPNAEDPNFVKATIGASDLKKLTRACGVPPVTMTLEEMIKNVSGRECVTLIDLVPEHKDERTGKQYGDSNKIRSYFQVGARKAGELTNGAGRSIAGTAAPAAAPAVRQPERPAAR